MVHMGEGVKRMTTYVDEGPEWMTAYTEENVK